MMAQAALQPDPSTQVQTRARKVPLSWSADANPRMKRGRSPTPTPHHPRKAKRGRKGLASLMQTRYGSPITALIFLNHVEAINTKLPTPLRRLAKLTEFYATV